MKKMIAAACAGAALLLSGPAHAENPENLWGVWNCTIRDGGMLLSMTTSYTRDGRFSTHGESTVQGPGGRIEMVAAGYGDWSVTDGELIEIGTSTALYSLSINGRNVEPGSDEFLAMLTNLRAATDGQTNSRTILSVTPQAYTITVEGYQQTCNRRD